MFLRHHQINRLRIHHRSRKEDLRELKVIKISRWREVEVWE
jgi:hypothetical protein